MLRSRVCVFVCVVKTALTPLSSGREVGVRLGHAGCLWCENEPTDFQSQVDNVSNSGDVVRLISAPVQAVADRCVGRRQQHMAPAATVFHAKKMPPVALEAKVVRVDKRDVGGLGLRPQPHVVVEVDCCLARRDQINVPLDFCGKGGGDKRVGQEERWFRESRGLPGYEKTQGKHDGGRENEAE